MWNVIIFEDDKEKRLEGDFPTKKDAEIWAESVGFESYKAVPDSTTIGCS